MILILEDQSQIYFNFFVVILWFIVNFVVILNEEKNFNSDGLDL